MARERTPFKEHCGDVIVFRGPLEWEQHFTAAIGKHGFVVSYTGPRREKQIAPIVTFRRAAD